MDLESFAYLQLPGGFILRGIEIEDAPMLDAIGRPALAKAVIEDQTISISLAAKQAPHEMSVSVYHELLEAMTVGHAHPPDAVSDSNEAGFEAAAIEAHRRHGLANPASVITFLHEYGFPECH
jgi:hypothetical protein